MTTTALGRWSCASSILPYVSDITDINIYDFDNTLFRTPLPSRSVWEGPTIGMLQGPEIFVGGGWWHDAQLLASVGGGLQAMEPVAWKGWWDEEITKSVRKSMSNPGHLTVLMTGRAQSGFSELLMRMVKAKGLAFDLIVLKPEVTPEGKMIADTAEFKSSFFQSVMNTYNNATQLTIYEDRAKQANQFSKFLEGWNATLSADDGTATRPPFKWNIDLVEPKSLALDPQQEIAQVARMINAHNAAITTGKANDRAIPYRFETNRKYTGYLIAPFYSCKLKALLVPDSDVDPDDIRPLADSIMLSFDPPRHDVLARAGGTGAKQEWRTVAVGSYRNNIWAVRVEPVESNRPHPTDRFPIVILGHLRKAKTSEARSIRDWIPIPADKQVVFPTEVGDKALVRIVEDRQNSTTGNQLTTNDVRVNDRPQRRDRRRPLRTGVAPDQSSADDSEAHPPRSYQRPRGNRGSSSSAYAAIRAARDRGPPYAQHQGRGGRGRGRGGRGASRGGGGGGGGAGGSGMYRSLDDAGNHGYSEAQGMQY